MMKFFLTLAQLAMLVSFLTACGGGSLGANNNSADSSSTVTYQVNEATNSSSLSWQAPTTYEDGNTLPPSLLGGYKIYAGSSVDSYALITTITDISDTDFVFTTLGKGLKFLFVTSFDIYGNESRLSDPIVVNIS